MQILRQLIFHTDVGGHRIRGLVQLRAFAVNASIRPCEQTGCQKRGFDSKRRLLIAKIPSPTGFCPNGGAPGQNLQGADAPSSRGPGLFPGPRQKPARHLRSTTAALWKNCAKPAHQPAFQRCSRLLIDPNRMTRILNRWVPDNRATGNMHTSLLLRCCLKKTGNVRPT